MQSIWKAQIQELWAGVEGAQVNISLTVYLKVAKKIIFFGLNFKFFSFRTLSRWNPEDIYFASVQILLK